MDDFTFLKDIQVIYYTESEKMLDLQLDILKPHNNKAAITDFSILLGGYVSSRYYVSRLKPRENRAGLWWTSSRISFLDGSSFPRMVSIDSIIYAIQINPQARYVCARPALSYSSITSLCKNPVRSRKGILEVEYGEYPQTIVNEKFSLILEKEFIKGNLNQTGKTYTTDSVEFTSEGYLPFQPKAHIEYEYKGKKYIRVIGNSNCDGEVLSDGRTIKSGEFYWVAVEPIKWIIDERKNIALSKKLLFAGVPFDDKKYEGDFESTIIKQYMDRYFSRDIIPSCTKDVIEEKNRRKR